MTADPGPVHVTAALDREPEAHTGSGDYLPDPDPGPVPEGYDEPVPFIVTTDRNGDEALVLRPEAIDAIRAGLPIPARVPIRRQVDTAGRRSTDLRSAERAVILAALNRAERLLTRPYRVPENYETERAEVRRDLAQAAGLL